METQYRLDGKKARMSDDFDMDYLIKNRENKRVLKVPDNSKSNDATTSRDKTSPSKPTITKAKNTKTLNYGSSSSDED